MKKIFTLFAVFFLYSTAVAFAYPNYATSPTNPGVNCANCHSDGRTWNPPTPPSPVTPPVVTPPPVTPPVPVDTNLNASYDASTGVLAIPAILVGDQIWSAQLQQESPTSDIFVLLMDTLTLNSAIDPATVDPSLLASFNSHNGRLDIPVFYVGQDQWRVRMKLVGFIPSPTFEVHIVNPGLGNLDDDEASIEDESDEAEKGPNSGNHGRNDNSRTQGNHRR